MEGQRFCGLPDHLEAVGTLCRWPNQPVTWCITDELPGMPLDHFQAALDWGWKVWEHVCGIKTQYVESASQARVLIGCQKIDGPAGILAQTELPCGPVQQVGMWFDVGEHFTDVLTPQQKLIILPDVAVHEQGHALGVGHAPPNTHQIMCPVYDPSVTTPGTWDVAEMTSRYGPPLVPPKPTGKTQKITVFFDGSVQSAKVLSVE